jgi:hypothetical protein
MKRPKLTAAATVGAFALLAVTHPVVADAAGLITSAGIADGSIRSLDIENDTLRSRDIKNDNTRSVDIKDGTLLRGDFRAGVLPSEHQAPSTVTELRSWTVHFDADADGRPSATSTAALPPGTLLSGVDLRSTGDTSACPDLYVDLSVPGEGGFLTGSRHSGDTDLRVRTQAPARVPPNSPGTLRAGAYCSNFMDPAPSPAFEVTFLFETTTPAASPATPFD